MLQRTLKNKNNNPLNFQALAKWKENNIATTNKTYSLHFINFGPSLRFVGLTFTKGTVYINVIISHSQFIPTQTFFLNPSLSAPSLSLSLFSPSSTSF